MVVPSALAWIALVVGGTGPSSSVGFRAPFQPRVYVSASGEYRLHVDPSSRTGAGPAEYELRRGAERAWSRRLPFSFVQAQVLDDGRAIGFAYSHGQATGRELGELLVAVLGSDGNVQGTHAIARRHSRAMHGDPDPLGQRVAADTAHGRFWIGLHDSHRQGARELWQAFDLDDARPGVVLEPETCLATDGRSFSFVAGLAAVPGTPWMLAHGFAGYDTLFALIDGDGKPVWSLRRTGDLMHATARKGVWSVLRSVGPNGAIESVGPEGRFSLVSFGSGERIAFRAHRNAAGGCDVEELSRSSWTPTPAAVVQAPDPTELPVIATVELRRGATTDATPQRALVAHGFDASGRPMLVRRDGDRGWTCLLLDDGGRLLLERPIPPFDEPMNGWPDWWAFPDGRWLVSVDAYGSREATKLWWVDPARGSIEAAEEPRLTALEHVAARSDGGFVALAKVDSGFQVLDGLVSVSPDGSARPIHGSRPALAGGWIAPEACALTTSGLVAVVDAARNRVDVFGGPVAEPRAIELDVVAPDRVRYPTGLLAGPDDTLFVVGSPNSDNGPAVLHIDLHGEVRAELRPRRADGSADRRLWNGLCTDPAGRLWSRDGDVMLRFDDAGHVDLTLGRAPSSETLHAIAGAEIDTRGRILLADGDSGAVHAFDANGRHLFVAVPAAGDFDRRMQLPRMAVDADGVLYASVGFRADWIRFAADGTRLGPLERWNEDLDFLPGSRDAWVALDFEDRLERLTPEGERRAVVERLPDRNWITHLQAFAVGSDGSLAVVDWTPLWKESLPQLAWYDALGSPLAQARLPDGSKPYRVATSPAWTVAHGHGGEAFLIRRSDLDLRRIRAPAAAGERSHWTVGFSPDGRELWWVDLVAARLHRCAL